MTLPIRLALLMTLLAAVLAFLAGWYERGVYERASMFDHSPFLRRLLRRLARGGQ